MPINISFGDFDTVCYSNQHNIIELINGAVNISISFNAIEANIDSINQQLEAFGEAIAAINQDIHDLNLRIDAYAQRLENVYNFSGTFPDSITGKKIEP